MLQFTLWPYAAKALIQHEFDTDHLNLWLTFPYPMNQLVMPDVSKWLCHADSVLCPVFSAAWQDSFTLLLNVPNISFHPERVLLAYDGPGPDVWNNEDPLRETLEMTCHKQYEPWGSILSLDVTS